MLGNVTLVGAASEPSRSSEPEPDVAHLELHPQQRHAHLQSFLRAPEPGAPNCSKPQFLVTVRYARAHLYTADCSAGAKCTARFATWQLDGCSFRISRTTARATGSAGTPPGRQARALAPDRHGCHLTSQKGWGRTSPHMALCGTPATRRSAGAHGSWGARLAPLPAAPDRRTIGGALPPNGNPSSW
eukprot:350568-Chlamydomonas_euryale.AAC.3